MRHALQDAGWQLIETQPAELVRVTEIWAHVLAGDVRPGIPDVRQIMSSAPFVMFETLFLEYASAKLPLPEVHAERNRRKTEPGVYRCDG